MRLDKFLVESGLGSRSQVKQLLKKVKSGSMGQQSRQLRHRLMSSRIRLWWMVRPWFMKNLSTIS